MAVESFPAGIHPSEGSRTSERAHVAEASFGDGYVQRAAAGINSVRRTYSLVCVGLPNAGPSGADALVGFFRRLAGVAGTWVCQRWGRERRGASRSTVRATFTEHFG